LATHRCGTCFFFQEAGFAGNGWCLHADRAKSADVRTLVRRNELACRNDWGQSLWTDPKAAAETGAARKLITAHAERPATEGEIGAMVNNRDGQPDPRLRADADDRKTDSPTGEDVVVGQITVMPPGMTGRRRLVDQVPPEITPRPTFREEDEGSDSTGRLVVRVDPPKINHSLDRSVSGTAASEPALQGRDRLRQREVAPAPERRRELDTSRRSPHRDLPASDTTRETPRHDRDDGMPFPSRSASHRSEGGPRPGDHDDESDRPRIDNSQDDRFTLEHPRGMRPAPIPGPVPSRELRRERDSESDGPRQAASRREPDLGLSQGDGRNAPVHPSRPMPAPLLDDRGALSSQPEPRSRAARRPVLPDLSDDFFTRGVIEPVETVGDARQRLVGSSAAERPQDRSEADARPTRPRPAVPRLGTDSDRPSSPVRSMPTVAEANRIDWTPPATRAAPSGRAAPAPQPDTGWAAPRPASAAPPSPAAQPHPVMAERHDEDEEPRREPVRMEPPTPLRPQPADFGEYGGWFDLQSVEPRLAPELKRACETCRDFRPAENGVRGWCTNGDAFTLRTVVNASDLPCISSFGCWWVPFDDVWLSEAAIRDHRNPTPLLDQTIAPDEFPVNARQRRRS